MNNKDIMSSYGSFHTTALILMRYQIRSPCICLSPSCCPMCLKGPDTSIHLFGHCPQIKEWNLFDIFGWQIPIPGDIETLITALILGHPSKKGKRTLWECFIHATFWKPWLERNNRSFNDKARNTTALMHSVTIMAISLSPPSPEMFCIVSILWLLSIGFL